MIEGFRKIILMLLIPLIMTGCWDSQDVNKRTITYSSGIDYENNKIEFSGEIAKIKTNPLENKETPEMSELYIYNASGSSLEEARANFNNKNAYPNFAGTIRAIVIGKTYGEKGIEPYINRTYFIPEFKSSVLAVISKEPAKELFSQKVENEISAGYAIESTVRTLSDNGAAIYKTIQELQSDIAFKDIGYLLTYVTNDNKVIENLGLIAFKDSKIVGTINPKESRGYLCILSKKLTYSSAVKLNNIENSLSIRNTLVKRKIKTTYKDKKINIFIDLKFNAQLDYEYKLQPLSNEDFKNIENKISNKLEEEINLAIKRSQNEFKSDVFGFARYFRAKNPREYRNINWKEEYPKAIVHVDVETKLIKTNLLDTNVTK